MNHDAVLTTASMLIDAADARTGDTLLVGDTAHLIISTWRRRNLVEMRHSTGATTIPADTRIRVRRQVRIIDHDSATIV